MTLCYNLSNKSVSYLAKPPLFQFYRHEPLMFVSLDLCKNTNTNDIPASNLYSLVLIIEFFGLRIH